MKDMLQSSIRTTEITHTHTHLTATISVAHFSSFILSFSLLYPSIFFSSLLLFSFPPIFYSRSIILYVRTLFRTDAQNNIKWNHAVHERLVDRAGKKKVLKVVRIIKGSKFSCIVLSRNNKSRIAMYLRRLLSAPLVLILAT